MAPSPVSGFISVAETTAHSAAVWRATIKSQFHHCFRKTYAGLTAPPEASRP